jgi:hypothetical protein
VIVSAARTDAAKHKDDARGYRDRRWLVDWCLCNRVDTNSPALRLVLPSATSGRFNAQDKRMEITYRNSGCRYGYGGRCFYNPAFSDKRSGLYSCCETHEWVFRM